MENCKTVAQTFLGETADIGFCLPQIGFFGGLGEFPKSYFYWNPNMFVTYEPPQNFKTVAQTFLGETAHFGFCPPKIGPFFIGAHAKI